MCNKSTSRLGPFHEWFAGRPDQSTLEHSKTHPKLMNHSPQCFQHQEIISLIFMVHFEFICIFCIFPLFFPSRPTKWLPRTVEPNAPKTQTEHSIIISMPNKGSPQSLVQFGAIFYFLRFFLFSAFQKIKKILPDVKIF